MPAQQAADSVVHRLAKPAMRSVAWTAVLAGLAALGLGARHNLRAG